MKESDLNIIFECWAGSNAYGTNTPESDEDFRGLAVAPISYYLGNDRFDQLQTAEPDRVIYDIKKFFKLATDCNPNIIELLFTDESDIITINESGQLLRDNRDLFISKKARYTFMGYAFSQLKRIKSHRNWLLNPVSKPSRSDYDLPEDKKLISDDHMGAFLNVLCGILENSLEEAQLSEETKEELRGANTIGLLQRNIPERIWSDVQVLTGASDNFIVAMMAEKKYRAAYANWKSYENWKKTRNPKRAAIEKKCSFDAKHASHLIRLVRMGEEILTGKGVIVKRPDAKELLEIKNGSMKYEEIESMIQNMDEKMNEFYKTSSLPHSPDHKKINKLLQKILARELKDDFERIMK